MTQKKPTIVFAPGCFDDFEGTQEELNEMIKEIIAKFEDGSFIEDMERADGEEEDPDVIEDIRDNFANAAIAQGINVVFGTADDLPDDVKEMLTAERKALH